jgi:hypothetical protein
MIQGVRCEGPVGAPIALSFGGGEIYETLTFHFTAFVFSHGLQSEKGL